MRPHFVYYLYYENGDLADIGRSLKPESRRRIKQRKQARTFSMKVSEPMSFKAACIFELSEQQKLNPPLVKRLVSSPGALGKKMPHSKAHIEALTANHVGMSGKKHSDLTKEKFKLRTFSAKTRKKMSCSHLGSKRTLEQKLIMSAAATKRWEREHLLQSGFGHPWRLRNLDEQTRKAVYAIST